MAYESASLYGLPIVSRRLVPFHRVDREQARELFIRHALVEGDWDTHHQFPQQNREVLDEVVARGHRFRRHHVLADDALLERRYDEILPAEVVSARHFDSWWKKVRRSRPGLLTFTAQSLLGADDPGIDDEGPSEAEIAAYIDRLRELKAGGCQIKLVQVYTVARQTAESFVAPLENARPRP